MSTLNRDSQPVRVEPTRPDVEAFESDAADGEIALIICWRGRRVLRVEIATWLYSTRLGQDIVARIESLLPPFLTLHRDGASSPQAG